MYEITLNGKKLNNPKYSLECKGFEYLEVQKLRFKFKGAKVKNTQTGKITPIEKF